MLLTAPLAVAFVALLITAAGWRFVAIPLGVFGCVCAWLCVIDARTRLLPNRVIYPALAAAAILLAASATIESTTATEAAAQLLGGLLGGLLGWGLMHLVWMFARGGMGYGDVRLAGYIGLHLGYFQPVLVLTALTLGFGVAAVAGGAMVAWKRNLRIKFALGPYLIAAAIAVLSFAALQPDLRSALQPDPPATTPAATTLATPALATLT